MKTKLRFTLLAIAYMQVGFSQIPEEGLVGYYKLDDGTYVDSSPSGVDLEEVEIGGFLLPSNDRFEEPNKALKFINQYLNMDSNPNVFDFDSDSMMSLCVWLKIDQTVIDWTAVLDNWAGFGIGGYYLGITPSQQIRWNVNAEPVIDSDPVPTGQWMHLAATYDGNTAYLYIDGNLVGQSALGVPLNPSPYSFTAGTQADLPNNIFPGIMDEILVYNRPLSNQEVLDIFNNEPLSVEDIDALSQKVVVAPNPVNASFTVSCEASLGTLASYAISDMRGSIITAKSMNDLNQVIDVSSLASGMYLITFRTNNGVEVTKRLIKK
jgi:Concanavalin A-like lectin/glucanases superfamily/Secretion system C-terminal sorting domain